MRLLAISLIVLFLFGCSNAFKNDDKNQVAYYALAQMQPAGGSQVHGKVWFIEGFGKIKIEVEISGLDKNSRHAIHLHEFGDCSAPDAKSAGGHYNPSNMAHGAPENEVRHAGDLGNLHTDSNGVAKKSLEVAGLSINSGYVPVLGRSVIVHKNPDDFVSQPTGGAGERIACGVIGAAKR